jgi:ribonuclease HI
VLENVELWQQLVEASRPHRYVFRWVRGHRGHPQNEYANHLATRAAREQTDSAGPVTSEFEEWLKGERLRGARVGDPDPFPPADAFVGMPAAEGIDAR